MTPQPWLYFCVKNMFRLIGPAFFRFHCHGRHWVPDTGGVILCSNHQSFFDPVIVGIALQRPCTFVARKTLFKQGFVNNLFTALNGVPIDRDGNSLEGIKSTLKHLRDDKVVLLFPEGTRTKDGNVQPLKPGVGLIARRAKVPIIPLGIDGAFDALPRTGGMPRLANIHLTFGEPIPTTVIASHKDAELIALTHQRMLECHAHSRAIVRGGG